MKLTRQRSIEDDLISNCYNFEWVIYKKCSRLKKVNACTREKQNAKAATYFYQAFFEIL